MGSNNSQEGSMAAGYINRDPEYLAIRRKEFQNAIKPYMDRLTNIHNLATFPRYMAENGSLELMPLNTDWQARIDAEKKIIRDFIKSNFPEFYTEDQDQD